MKKNIMLDLETWGTRPGCAIRSIGAACFDSHEVAGTFYRNVADKTCEALGLHKDPGTVAWWAKQSKAAQDSLLKEPIGVTEAIEQFFDFFKTQGGQFLWCHGGNFDAGIVEEAARIAGLTAPWKFWNVRCTRTLFGLTGFNIKTFPRKGTYHNALDDALHQVTCVQRSLGGTTMLE